MRVLVADDETTSRLVVQAVVQKLGHECLVAHDGDLAWTLLQKSHVDVLITDWMMPGLDGTELCRRIRAHADTYAYTYISRRPPHTPCPRRAPRVALQHRHVRPDEFKLYNDTNGHPQGDTALQRIAALLATDPRDGDAAYRYGGEEFIVLLAEETLPGAVRATDRLRVTIESLAIPHRRNNPPGILTISAGVATYAPHTHITADAVLEQADRALYIAKQQGRNRVAAPQPARVPSEVVHEAGRT